MAQAPRRRRGHAAASARILTAGLSSTAAFGLVAVMALTAVGDEEAARPAAASVPAAGPGVILAPPTAARVARPQPATRPVTRTRGS